MSESPLTTAAILSAATEILTRPSTGYRLVPDAQAAQWPIDAARAFEDPFTVVAVCVFDTWDALVENWPEAQNALVEIMSEHLSATDPKAWDGYLVLLSAAGGDEAGEQVQSIRYDTARVRKLISTAPGLVTLSDVEQVLLPLLPLSGEIDLTSTDTPLEIVAGSLREEFDAQVVDAALQAFAEQRPIVEAIHVTRGAKA